jgi:WXXGXW repeat (2 copies)
MMKSWSRSLLPALLALILPTLSMAQISVGVSVNVPPPELPVYDQPPIPGDGYIWTPGYWAWSDDTQDYYWVPGTWVSAPEPDYLWTPGYWGTEGAVFLWHAGYWGPHVGFYGGVNYGYGYGGNGYEGGYWQGGRLFYNRSVNNISNVHITNVYNRTVVNNVTVNRVSYNGGNGLHAQPNAAQLAAAHDRHIGVTPDQRQHEQAARGNPSLRVSENHGHPPIAATSRPGALTGEGVVGARHTGTLSVVHPNPSQQRDDSPQQRPQAPRTATPRQPQPAPEARRDLQRNESPREVQPPPREVQPPTREVQPPAEQRRAAPPEQPHPQRPSTPPQPQAHPNAPRPAEHAPEHEEEHEHH